MTSTVKGPRVRLVDAVAVSNGAGLVPASGRLIELSLEDLEQLVHILGGDGLIALSAYLRVLRRETAPSGDDVLVVDNFSADWLRSVTALSKGAAYKAQAALKQVGLFESVVSTRGVGSRGVQRGVLNTELVLIPGGATGDPSSLGRRGSSGPRRSSTTRIRFPDFCTPGERGSETNSRSSDIRESGTTQLPLSLLNPDLPVSGSPGLSRSPLRSSSRKKFFSLMGTEQGPGLLQTALRPALTESGRVEVTRRRLHEVFGSRDVAQKAGPLLTSLDMAVPERDRPAVLAGVIELLVLGEQDPHELLEKVHVARRGFAALSPMVAGERFIVGVVVGLGMPDVKSWGAWLYGACATPGNLKSNRVADDFVRLLETLQAPSVAKVPGTTGSVEARVPQAEPAAAAPVGESADLAPEVVAELLPQARLHFPVVANLHSFADAAGQARLVRMFLNETA